MRYIVVRDTMPPRWDVRLDRGGGFRAELIKSCVWQRSAKRMARKRAAFLSLGLFENNPIVAEFPVADD